MHPHMGTACKRREHRTYQRSLQPFVHRHVQRQSDHRLPGCPEKQRAAQIPQTVQVRDHLQILLPALGETDARIQDDVFLPDPGSLRDAKRLLKIRLQLRQKIPVLRIPPIVHQAAGKTASRKKVCHLPLIIF